MDEFERIRIFQTLITSNWFSTKNVEMSEMMEMMMASNDATFADVLEAVVKEDDAHLVQKVKDFAPRRKDLLKTAHRAEGKFVVVLHNDAWCNNFMFK